MGKVIDISAWQEHDRAAICDEAAAALNVFERELDTLVTSMVHLAMVYEARGVDDVATQLIFHLELARAKAKEAFHSSFRHELPLRIDPELIRRLDDWRRAQPGTVSLSRAVSFALREFLDQPDRH